MYIKQERSTWLSCYGAARKYISDAYRRLQNGVAPVGWVMLGLGLIALLVEVLAAFPGWFGPILFGPKTAITIIDKLSDIPVKTSSAKVNFFVTVISDPLSLIVPVIATLLLYITLTILQPGIFPWPRSRALYLLVLCAALSTLILAARFAPLPGAAGQFSWCILAYALVAHTRVTAGKKTGWLIEAVALAAVLICLTAASPHQYIVASHTSYSLHTTNSTPLPPDPSTRIYQPVKPTASDFDQLLLHIPMLGIQVGSTLQVFQFSIWLLGLLCLHIYTAIGVHERAARQRSDRLVRELTLAQEQLRAYALRAEELATMRERERVAREVHDTLAQGLAAIKMHLETGAKVFYEQPDLAYRCLERARALAGEHLDETRNTILNLRSDALDGRTLPEALALLATTWQEGHNQGGDGREVSVCISGIAKDAPFWLTVPPAIELTCYRIAQEAFSNASRHGHARHIDVELSIERDELCLTITDDGSGFDPAAISSCTREGRFGILGMHERLKLLNGRLEIISAPGAGTHVVAMIPLKTAGLAPEPAEKRG
ncbi:MAG TPA: sensor histidine kinase [Ktedonobacteraceae bacterium]|nr:sensor histidine kinase [Ktedonobacteraceae bacterium]